MLFATGLTVVTRRACSKSATLFLQDIYAGWGLEGVERGTVKALRVVTLDFRVAGIGHNGNNGPAGGALAVVALALAMIGVTTIGARIMRSIRNAGPPAAGPGGARRDGDNE